MRRPKVYMGYVGSARNCVGIKYMHGKFVSTSHMLDQQEWR